MASPHHSLHICFSWHASLDPPLSCPCEQHRRSLLQRTLVLYERQCSQQWYTKWKGAWLFCSQSLHRMLCTATTHLSHILVRSNCNQASVIEA